MYRSMFVFVGAMWSIVKIRITCMMSASATLACTIAEVCFKGRSANAPKGWEGGFSNAFTVKRPI